MAVLHSNCCSPERGNDMKILFFEDREEDIQGIVDYCIERDYDCFHDKFVDGFSKIEEYDTDIVIVDLKNAQDNFEGCDILEKIWEHRFREIINRGIGGNRIVDLYARIKADVWNFNPDILSVLIGVNDVWHEQWGNGVDLERFEKIYRMLIEDTKQIRRTMR